MARPRIYDTAAEAVSDIPDGAMIALGGFTAALGAPKELFRALVETTTCKDLTFIGNGTPQVAIGDISERRMLPMPLERLRKCICSFPGGQSTRGGFVNPLQEAFARGQVELELVPQGTLAERLRAGGAGIPAFFTPTGAGTRFEEGKEAREFEGRRYVMERWLRPDYAFVHAIKGDSMGNLVYRNTARNFNPPMAAAARCTIAEIEELVAPGEIDPHHVVTPGIFVNRLVVLGQALNA